MNVCNTEFSSLFLPSVWLWIPAFIVFNQKYISTAHLLRDQRWLYTLILLLSLEDLYLLIYRFMKNNLDHLLLSVKRRKQALRKLDVYNLPNFICCASNPEFDGTYEKTIGKSILFTSWVRSLYHGELISWSKRNRDQSGILMCYLSLQSLFLSFPSFLVPSSLPPSLPFSLLLSPLPLFFPLFLLPSLLFPFPVRVQWKDIYILTRIWTCHTGSQMNCLFDLGLSSF